MKTLKVSAFSPIWKYRLSLFQRMGNASGYKVSALEFSPFSCQVRKSGDELRHNCDFSHEQRAGHPPTSDRR